MIYCKHSVASQRGRVPLTPLLRMSFPQASAPRYETGTIIMTGSNRRARRTFERDFAKMTWIQFLSCTERLLPMQR